MRTKGLSATFIFVASLTAYQTVAQKQAQVIHENDTTAVANLKVCITAVYNSQSYAPLRVHVPLDGQFSLQQLTDQSYATDEEIRAIYAGRPQTNACRRRFLNQLATVTPGYVPIFASAYDRSEDSLIRLVQKKVTWGEYTTAVRAIAQDAQTQLRAEDQRIAAGLEASHEAELSRREAAAAALGQFIQNQ